MRARRRAQLFAWIMFVVVARAGSTLVALAGPAGNDNLPEPIAWRQLTFSIPFKVAADMPAAELPAEFRLYVSKNLGVKWDLAQSARSGERAFGFQAPGDGEYWFQIRSVDRQGHLLQDVGGPPELRVIVDTLQPRLDLAVTRGEAGEIRAHWQAVDPTLDPDSLKIEYQNASGQWRPVAVDRPPTGGDRSTSTGTLTWYPNDAPPGAVAVRAEIRDRAGNVTLKDAQAKSEFALPPTSANSSPPRGGLATNNSAFNSPAASNWQTTPNWMTAPQQPSPTRSSLPTNSIAGTAGATPWPADQSSTAAFGRNPIPSLEPNMPSLADRAWEPASPAIRNQVLTPSAVPQAASPARIAQSNNSGFKPAALPSGQRPQMVNARSFDIDYEVNSIGASGVAKVELWGTRDGGRTWTSYGTDNDNRSPIRATVEGEGVYGFSVVIQSGTGVSGLPPRSGEQPQIWIAVDLSKPVVQLTSVRSGDGPHAGELTIGWEAHDNALVEHPITLLYGDKPGGPWNMIASGLDNSGQFVWRPDNRVPEQVFLRIEGRDEAGNVGVYESAQPVAIERIRPEGRIRGVRPASDPSGRVETYQFFR